MDNYLVSARKYRPVTFDSVVGQRSLTTTLKNSIATGKLAHAYLFCGPRGVGKTTCARIFAKTINCLSPHAESGEACNTCESCEAFVEGRSFNIFELDAASNNSVEDIRQIIEQVNIPPQVGKYKVFIIDEVHMLSQAAFNAFLKTLEEPPEHVIFILATTEKHKVLPTILSRCQIYDFSRITIQDIVDHLADVAQREGIAVERDALNVIAQKADGGMRDALSIFDQVSNFSGGEITYTKVVDDLNVLDYDYYFKAVDFLLNKDIPHSLLLFNHILLKGFEGNEFMGGLAAHFRNLLVAKDASTAELLEVGETIRAKYVEQAQRCRDTYIYRAVKICNTCEFNYRLSKNKRLSVEIALIELAQCVDDDGESYGRGPTKILKPIFATLSAKPEQAVAPVSITPAAKNNTSIGSSSAAPTLATSSSSSAVSASAATVQTDGSDVSSAVRDGQRKTAPKPLRTRSRTISIRSTLSEKQEKQAVEAEKTQVEDYGDVPFSEVDLKMEWMRFAQLLPIEETAMRGRMMGLEPTLKENGRVDVPVENERVMSDYARMRNNIEHFLRRQLHNGQLTLDIRLTALDEKRQAFTKKELFQEMLKKSEALAMVCKELKLELA